MSTNQGGGDFQQGNCQGFCFSNQNEPVQHYVSPQAPQAQTLIMGDSHGDIGTGSFAEFQQFLQWKHRSESMSMNSSLNSSFGQQSTRLSNTSHVPTLTSTPNDSKTKHVKRKHKKRDVSSSSSGSSDSDSDSDSSSSSESDGSYHRKRKKHSRKSRRKSHKKSRHKKSYHRRSRSRSQTPPQKSRSKRSQSKSPSPSPKTSAPVSVTVSPNPPKPAAKHHKSTLASVSPPPTNVGMTVGVTPPNPAAANVSVTKVDSVLGQPKCCRSKRASVSPAAANVTVKTEPGLPIPIRVKQEKIPQPDKDYLTVRIKKEDLRGSNVVEHEGHVLAEWKPQPNRYVYSYFVLVKYGVHISCTLDFLPGIHHTFLN